MEEASEEAPPQQTLVGEVLCPSPVHVGCMNECSSSISSAIAPRFNIISALGLKDSARRVRHQ